ncbi:hypothetical protein V6N13_011311 [Hibiscus sabdariffa]
MRRSDLTGGTQFFAEGLETLDYLDNLKNRERFTEGDALTFESEVDIYLSAPTKIVILDHERKRTFVLERMGFLMRLYGTPGIRKQRRWPTLVNGDDDYKHMLWFTSACVEKPSTLKPGEEWKGRLEVSAVPSRYSSGQLDPGRAVFI